MAPANSQLFYRVDGLEKDMIAVKQDLQSIQHDIKNDLASYVPVNIHDIRLKTIQDALQRMEEKQDQLRDRQEALDKEIATLQIRALWFFVSTIILTVLGVLSSYISHIITK